MKISQIDNNINFNGKVIVKNAISPNQKHLFNLHKNNLDNMIKDMPFDLFIEQSKSKKTISLTTNVENTSAYFVRKNKQNFEEAAGYVIEEGKNKSKVYQDMVKAQNMLDAGTNAFKCVIFGKFKLAREFEKEHAKLAVADFDVYKQIPHLVLNGVPKEVIKQARNNAFKYRIYKLFTPKTQEEKQFLKMRREYLNELKAKNIKPKTVTLELPRLYY